MHRLLLASLLAASASFLAAAQKPNVVLILADDLGWRDLACYGSPWHETPNLDRLAREGMRFDTAYAPAPICSASRASILTGKSPARLGLEFVTRGPSKVPDIRPLTPPPYTQNLSLAEQTLAEVLGPAGYRTGFFGKWHLSRHNGYYLGWSTTHGPLQQGFETGSADFGSHSYGYENNPELAKQPLPPNEYPEDSLTDKAIAFVRERGDRPFFLYLSHYYVHTPIKTRAEWLTKKYQARLPADAYRGRAVYAAMVEILDHHIGRLLAAIDEAGLAENTLVIFTSDNGGHPDFAANGPLRGSKWNVYEGGIRVPFIARWPGRVPSGATSDTPIIGSDLMPTLSAVAGVSPPAPDSLDGVNLLPLFQGQEVARREPLVWHFPYYHPEGDKFQEAKETIGVNDFQTSQTRPQSAIRVGDYTLVHFYENDRDELYHLPDDIGEMRDIGDRQPERRRDMRKRLDDYLLGVKARLPAPRQEPAN